MESADEAIRDRLLKDGRQLDQFLRAEERYGCEVQAERLLRVRNRYGKTVALVANRAQREFERRRGEQNIVLKARQMGLSTWIAARLFLKTIMVEGTVSVQVAHTQEAAESLFGIVHRFYRELPEEMRKVVLKTARANARQIVFPELDSEYRVETAGDRNAGRGLTITHLHCSEVARWPGNAFDTLQGLRAAVSPEGTVVLESTPMGAAGCFWQEWRDANSTGMVRHFFPWWWEEAYVRDPVEEGSLGDEERRLREQHGLTLGQVAYRRYLQASFRGMAKQEYAEDADECFLASGSCYFEVDAIDRRLKEITGPIAAERNEELRTWLLPDATRSYVVAVDPAGGGAEGDFAAAQVLDVETGMQCAELQARCLPLELARRVAELATKYNRATVAVERNNHGAAVLAYLRTVEKYTQLYCDSERQEGFLTTTLSRPRILAEMGAVLVETPKVFKSERLLRECRSFVRHANGKVEAQAGEHDDCVMAMAIGLAVLAEMPVARRAAKHEQRPPLPGDRGADGIAGAGS